MDQSHAPWLDTSCNVLASRWGHRASLCKVHVLRAVPPVRELGIQPLFQSLSVLPRRLRKEFVPQENQILFDNSGKTTRELLAPVA